MYLKNTKCCYFSLFIWCAEILRRKVVCGITKVNQYSLTTLHKMQLINILNLVNNSGGNKISACEYHDPSM